MNKTSGRIVTPRPFPAIPVVPSSRYLNTSHPLLDQRDSSHLLQAFPSTWPALPAHLPIPRTHARNRHGLHLLDARGRRLQEHRRQRQRPHPRPSHQARRRRAEAAPPQHGDPARPGRRGRPQLRRRAAAGRGAADGAGWAGADEHEHEDDDERRGGAEEGEPVPALHEGEGGGWRGARSRHGAGEDHGDDAGGDDRVCAED